MSIKSHSENMFYNYSSIQFDQLSSNWEIRMYVTRPGSDVPLDASEESLVSKPKTRDEIFNKIITKHFEAWRRLSEM
jgi:hypothetical protein